MTTRPEADLARPVTASEKTLDELLADSIKQATEIVKKRSASGIVLPYLWEDSALVKRVGNTQAREITLRDTQFSDACDKVLTLVASEVFYLCDLLNGARSSLSDPRTWMRMFNNTVDRLKAHVQPLIGTTGDFGGKIPQESETLSESKKALMKCLDIPSLTEKGDPWEAFGRELDFVQDELRTHLESERGVFAASKRESLAFVALQTASRFVCHTGPFLVYECPLYMPRWLRSSCRSFIESDSSLPATTASDE